MYSNLRKDL